jgi:hypothetical protein
MSDSYKKWKNSPARLAEKMAKVKDRQDGISKLKTMPVGALLGFLNILFYQWGR